MRFFRFVEDIARERQWKRSGTTATGSGNWLLMSGVGRKLPLPCDQEPGHDDEPLDLFRYSSRTTTSTGDATSLSKVLSLQSSLDRVEAHASDHTIPDLHSKIRYDRDDRHVSRLAPEQVNQRVSTPHLGCDRNLSPCAPPARRSQY